MPRYNTSDDFLEHFGILGMHWGIRKDDSKINWNVPKSPKNPNGYDPNTYLSQREANDLKYGRDAHTKKQSTKDLPIFSRLTPQQKHLMVAAGVSAVLVGGVLATAYVTNKTHDVSSISSILDPKGKESIPSDIYDKLNHFHKLSDRPLSKFNLCSPKYFESGVNLRPGKILKRISSVEEKSLYSDGFYAAFKPSDVKSYTGLFTSPHSANFSHMISIRASKGVKAPSATESISIYKSLFKDFDVLSKTFGAQHIAKLSSSEKDKILSGMAKESLARFAVSWNHSTAGDPMVQEFFRRVKALGYNALIDFNNSGFLTNAPLRVITNDGFSVVKSEVLHSMMLQVSEDPVKEFIVTLDIDGIKFNSLQEKGF